MILALAKGPPEGEGPPGLERARIRRDGSLAGRAEGNGEPVSKLQKGKRYKVEK
jgi:hypothetical protein